MAGAGSPQLISAVRLGIFQDNSCYSYPICINMLHAWYIYHHIVCLQSLCSQSYSLYSLYHIPGAPCMVYSPKCGPFFGPVLVNIPYVEHMGSEIANGLKTKKYMSRFTSHSMFSIIHNLTIPPLGVLTSRRKTLRATGPNQVFGQLCR